MPFLNALPTGAIDAATLMQQPATPFVWGQGGARVSPDQIARQRELAAQQLGAGMDYSPVGSWTQGLARAAQGVVGALGMRRADKEDAANQAASDAITQDLIKNSAGSDPLAGILLNPNTSPEARQLAMLRYKHDNPTPAQPHYWETNNGSLGMIGPNGVPQIVYDDPTPKMLYMQVKDPSTGELRIIPVPMGSGAPSAAPPTAPVGKLTPIGPSLSDDAGGSILGGAQDSGVIAPADAAAMRASLGPNGNAAFQNWMTEHNVRMGN